jgi:hypothetical protein
MSGAVLTQRACTGFRIHRSFGVTLADPHTSQGASGYRRARSFAVDRGRLWYDSPAARSACRRCRGCRRPCQAVIRPPAGRLRRRDRALRPASQSGSARRRGVVCAPVSQADDRSQGAGRSTWSATTVRVARSRDGWITPDRMRSASAPSPHWPGTGAGHSAHGDTRGIRLDVSVAELGRT